MRRSDGRPAEVETTGGGRPTAAPPEVRIEVCRAGCTGVGHGHAVAPGPAEPEWALFTAWSWLTRPVEPGAADADEPAPDDEPERLPWWDARSDASRRRAVLPLVLLGELQAGVLLRAVWEVLQGAGPTA